MSWTLDLAVAKRFAHRWGEKGSTGRVATALVSRDQVLGYFEGRNEREVVWPGRGILLTKA